MDIDKLDNLRKLVGKNVEVVTFNEDGYWRYRGVLSKSDQDDYIGMFWTNQPDCSCRFEAKDVVVLSVLDEVYNDGLHHIGCGGRTRSFRRTVVEKDTPNRG